jgi:hypothetical protein
MNMRGRNVMLINKITTGFVVQVFDTEKGRFVRQEFTAGDQCDYEDKDGEPVDRKLLETDGKEAYLPFDMVQPEATAPDHASVVERLAGKAESAGLEPEDFDEFVHELASSVAADINNGGLEDQIKYLVEGLGAEHAERQLDGLIEERTETEGDKNEEEDDG